MEKDEDMQGTLVTVDQAAEFLHVSRQTIYRHIGDGKIESVKIRGCRRILYDSLLKLIKPKKQ